MAGLVPDIHVYDLTNAITTWDGRDKRGHDVIKSDPTPACQKGTLLIGFARLRMIPKSGYRFSEKIMRKTKAASRAAVAQLVQSA